MVQLILKREALKEIYRPGAAMIVAGGLGTREGIKLHFKKESGISMSLGNRPLEN